MIAAVTACTLSDEELDALLTRAGAATPGPWSAKTLHVSYSTVWAPQDPGDRIADVLEAPDAAHIAGADPDTIIAVVTELKARRAAR